MTYTPISILFGWLSSTLSRHFEYQADAFSVKTYQNPEAMILALKKLSMNNLSNLTPHPLKVALSYSHTPTLLRVKAIRAIKQE